MYCVNSNPKRRHWCIEATNNAERLKGEAQSRATRFYENALLFKIVLE